MTAEARIAELEAENAALRAQVRELPALREQVTTLRKQGQALLAALETVFAGHPLSPAFA